MNEYPRELIEAARRFLESDECKATWVGFDWTQESTEDDAIQILETGWRSEGHTQHN